MNSYELSRKFWDYSFENPHRIKPYHSAIYFFAIEHCNRLGWKKTFGFPTSMVLEATGIKSYSSYKKYFDELTDWGFFNVVEYSKNQYSSNIIELTSNVKANAKALDKAFIKHGLKQSESTGQSIDSIDKQDNNLTKKPTKQGNKGFTPPLYQELNDYFFEKLQSTEQSKFEAEKFMDFYSSKGWMIGKNKMKDWKAAVRNWTKGIKNNNNGKEDKFSDEAVKQRLDDGVEFFKNQSN